MYESYTAVTHFHQLHRNVLHSPSAHNAYSSNAFPALVDSLYGLKSKVSRDTDIDQSERWNTVAKQLAIAMTFVHSASDLLDSFGGF